MEGGSISQRKSYTAQFKLEVVEVAKESLMKNFLDLNSVMFNK